MGLLGRLFGSGDPAAKWTREPGLRIEVDLDAGSLCGVRLGSRPDGLSRLGAPSNPEPARDEEYAWNDLGIEARVRKGLLVAFVFRWGATPCAAAFVRGGAPLPLGTADVQRLLGAPWHRFADPDHPEAPLRLFYESPRLIEWEAEVDPSGALVSLTLAAPPTMADVAVRRACRAEKPWPPI
jgi:hypothetical protein